MKKLVCFLLLTLFPIIANAHPKWVEVGIGSHDVRWNGGTGTLAVAGTFGGTTVTFFYCAPLKDIEQCYEVDATACTFTGTGFCNFFLGPGDLRLTVTGGTPSITAVAAGPTQASAGIGGDGGGGTSIAIDADQDGTDNVFVASDMVTFDTDDDGEVDFEFIGSGVGGAPFIVSTIRIVGDDILDRHLVIAFANSGLLVQFNATTQANSGMQMVGQALISAQVSSATLPAFIPFFSDPLTGYGRDTVSGALSLTDNGVEVMRVQDNGVAVTDGLVLNFPKSLVPPAGASEGASFWDETAKEICFHDGIAFQCMSPAAPVFEAVSGEMHQTNPGGGGGPHISMTTPGTFVGWVDAIAGPLVGGVTFTNNATADFLAVPTTATYLIAINTSYSGDVNRIYICRLHINGALDGALIAIEMGNSSAVNSGAGSTTVALTAGDELSVRCTKEAGAGTDDMSIRSMVLEVLCTDC